MMKMKPFSGLRYVGLLFLCFSMSACGEEVSAGKAGLFIDDSTTTFLKTEFDDTKACAKFENGAFEDVSIAIMPPTFPCKHYAGGCSGEYVNPNHLKVGSLYVWRHEVIHYLLDLNTGDPDAGHRSDLFKTCI
ncbi:MAG: hypothetical protein GXO96_05715 [Nitrospirae bacterium]|nr:hypothetical protein [Candidatus Manganitrophaceae bacterium]